MKLRSKKQCVSSEIITPFMSRWNADQNCLAIPELDEKKNPANESNATVTPDDYRTVLSHGHPHLMT